MDDDNQKSETPGSVVSPESDRVAKISTTHFTKKDVVALPAKPAVLQGSGK